MPNPESIPLTPKAETDLGRPIYDPTENERKLLARLEDKFQRWAEVRRSHEPAWFVNTAFFRGQHRAVWDERDQRLSALKVPAHKVKPAMNRLFGKIRARNAKFQKNRVAPMVMPASPDFEDRLDARATTRALEYAARKLHLENKYRLAQLWASQTGHGYWWFRWNPTTLGRIKVLDPESQQEIIVDAPIGDVELDVSGPFEVLVADPGLSELGDQPEIMRIKLRTVEEVRQLHPQKGKYVQAEGTEDSTFNYQTRIAGLNPVSGTSLSSGQTSTDASKPTLVLVKEWFAAPSAEFPKGRYAVFANGVLLKQQEELPYEFWDMDNPYPVVDFPDLMQAGQYWVTTVLEQLVPVQREYNTVRAAVGQHMRGCVHPKLFAAMQHRLPPASMTSDGLEIIEYWALPHIKEPYWFTPPNISADVWKNTELLKDEFDAITQIYPEAEGRIGQATSGFQTNLLQEAADAVHGPDIRLHELAQEEAFYKIRRLMKQGYTVPRLLTLTGRDLQPEVIEFSADEIDEHADIIVQAGSALPTLKTARVQAVMELYRSGLLGNPADPETTRRATMMLELGTVDDAYDWARRDEDQARIENQTISKDQPLKEPDFFENHDIHYRVHTDFLKAPDAQAWDDTRRLGLIAHVILHAKYKNPASAIELATRYNMVPLVADLIQKQQAMAAAGQPIPGAGPAPPGAPPPTPQAVKAASGNDQTSPEGGFGPQGTESLAS